MDLGQDATRWQPPTGLSGTLCRIALALELRADVALLDERDGRRLAQRLGLRVLGVVGVLLEAKTQGAIAHVRLYLDGLRSAAGFYVDDALYAEALRLAGEEMD